jgi:hypothetical protein
MLRQFSLCALAFLLSIPGGGGCDSGKQYPTAPAPKTLDVKPPGPRPDPAPDEDLDDDEDLDEGGSDTRRIRRGGRRLPRGPSVRVRERPRPGQGPKTINGHPKGPRAEVFNAVVNNAMASASRCFATEPAGRTLSFRVKMTVANAGTVKAAKVTAGPNKPAIRKCLVGVVKALSFPSFEGDEVSQTIPFTAIRN